MFGFFLRLDNHVNPRLRLAHTGVAGSACVDNLALGVINDLLAGKGVAFLDDLGLIDQNNAFGGGIILNGFAISLYDGLVR